MSENLEIALQGIQAFNRHDAGALQAICAPDVEWVPLRAALEGTSYRGPDAVSRMFDDFDESWGKLRFDARGVGADCRTLVSCMPEARR